MLNQNGNTPYMVGILIDRISTKEYRLTHVEFNQTLENYINEGCSLRGTLNGILRAAAQQQIPTPAHEATVLQIYGPDDFAIWTFEPGAEYMRENVKRGATFDGTRAEIGSYLTSVQEMVGSDYPELQEEMHESTFDIEIQQ